MAYWPIAMAPEKLKYKHMVMIKQNAKALATLRRSFVLGTLIALAIRFGHAAWLPGFVIGCVLSLFSLFSLQICVPALFYPGASERSKGLLMATLLMKMPLYAIGLWIATHFGITGAVTAFAGVTLVPAVITLEAMAKLAREDIRRQRLLRSRPKTAVPCPKARELRKQVAELVAEYRQP